MERLPVDVQSRIESGHFSTLTKCDGCGRVVGLALQPSTPPIACEWLGRHKAKRAERVTGQWEDWCTECFGEMESKVEMVEKDVKKIWIHSRKEADQVCFFCKSLDDTLSCSRCAITLVSREDVFDSREGRRDLYSSLLSASGDKPICAKCWVGDPPVGTLIYLGEEHVDKMLEITHAMPIFDPYGTQWHLEEVDWRDWVGKFLELCEGRKWVIHV